MKLYYHATSYTNAKGIMKEGIKPGFEGCVYVCETKEDALKFAMVRTFGDIIIFEAYLDEKYVEETFDHSYGYFKCKAFGYLGHINVDMIYKAWLYPRSTKILNYLNMQSKN